MPLFDHLILLPGISLRGKTLKWKKPGCPNPLMMLLLIIGEKLELVIIEKIMIVHEELIIPIFCSL